MARTEHAEQRKKLARGMVLRSLFHPDLDALSFGENTNEAFTSFAGTTAKTFAKLFAHEFEFFSDLKILRGFALLPVASTRASLNGPLCVLPFLSRHQRKPASFS